MRQRVLIVVAMALFSVIAGVSVVLVDLVDHSFPIAASVRSSVVLDLGDASIDDTRALKELSALSVEHRLGLLRVATNMTTADAAETLISLDRADAAESGLPRFGTSVDTRILGTSALAHSYPDGAYFVTGGGSVDALTQWIERNGIRAQRQDAGPWPAALLALTQPACLIAVAAAVMLFGVLALYWLAVLARGRALRVLGGVSERRIQLEDLGSFAWQLALSALAVAVVASLVVGAVRGRVFVPAYVGMVLALEALVIGSAVAVAALALRWSWPSERELVQRKPALGSLAGASRLALAVTFAMAFLTIGPSISVWTDSSAVARQQAVWTALREQVVLAYSGADGPDAMTSIREKIGSVMESAEKRDALALSYTFSVDQLNTQAQALPGGATHLAFVNERWLRLMQRPSTDLGRPMGRADLPSSWRTALDESLIIWTKGQDAAGVKSWWSHTKLYSVNGGTVPVARGSSGELIFPDRMLVFVVDHPAERFDSDFLTAASSTSNILLTGVTETLDDLQKQDLRKAVEVRYAAEDGILRARFASYTAWLYALAIAALLVSFVLAAFIGALITSVVDARRDFPQRLSGSSPWRIAAPRLIREWVVGLIVVGVLLAVRGTQDVLPMLAFALLGFVVSGASHVAVGDWVFKSMTRRAM